MSKNGLLGVFTKRTTLKLITFCPTWFAGHKRSRGVRAGEVQLPGQARDHHPQEPDVLRQVRRDSRAGGRVGVRQEHRRRAHGALLRPLQRHDREYLRVVNTRISCMKKKKKDALESC